jgi:hypothetical protein
VAYHTWHVLASSITDMATVLDALLWRVFLMAPVPWQLIVAVFLAVAAFAPILDRIKLLVLPSFKSRVTFQ